MRPMIVSDTDRDRITAALERRLDAERALDDARAAYAATLEDVYRTGGYSTFTLAAATGVSHQRVYNLIRSARDRATA